MILGLGFEHGLVETSINGVDVLDGGLFLLMSINEAREASGRLPAQLEDS